MSHPSEQDLVLHYYSEGHEALALEQHLDTCEPCRALFGSLERTLNHVDALTIPEPDADYETRVWRRLQPSLPVQRGFSFLAPAWRWAGGGLAFASLLLLAFLGGRFYPPSGKHVPAVANMPSGEGLLQVAVGDHLERSQMILTELANRSAAGPLDISFEQARAADLLGENRLYRQTALGAGDAVLAGVLEELERVLMEVEHAPARISPAELDEFRLRLKAEGLLFKLRVLGSNVRNPEEPVNRNPL